MVGKVITEYNIKLFPFTEIIGEMLNVRQLDRLHEFWTPNEVVSREDDQQTPFHKLFYENWSMLESRYRYFIDQFVPRTLGETEFVYQKIPTFRVQLPGNLSVGEFHKDADYGHSPYEINFFVPLTFMTDTSSVWIEAAPFVASYKPVTLSVGQVLIFDGANLKHGNVVNETGRTRVSFDFRVIPKALYAESDYRSINTNKRFVVGEYFDATWEK